VESSTEWNEALAPDVVLPEWRAVVDTLAEGVIAAGPDGVILYANRAAEALLGWSGADLVGRALIDIIPERFRQRHVSAFEAVAEGATPTVIGRPLRLPALRKDGTETPVELVISAVEVPEGNVYVGLLRDVTDRLELEGSGELGNQLVSILAEVGSLDDALPRVLGAIGAAMGFEVVQLWSKTMAGLVVRDAWAIDREAMAPFLAASHRIGATPSGVPRRVLSTGEAIWIDDVGDDQTFPRRESAVSVGLRSGVAVPVVLGPERVGVLELFSVGVRHRDADAVRRLVDLGREIGPYIDRREREEEQLAASERIAAISRTLQQSLLPPRLPVIPRADVAGRYLGATDGMEVGGDFYDAFRTGRGSWGLALGDVCGKGAEAAAVTSLIRYTMRAATMQTRSPARALAIVNDAMLAEQDADAAFDRFATAVLAMVRPQGDALAVTLASAGHPTPLIRRADGAVEEVRTVGALLGVIPDLEATNVNVTLRAGDALVLYTDGVTEAGRGRAELGAHGLIAALEGSDPTTASGMCDRIVRAAISRSGDSTADDTAVIVLRAT